MTIKADESQELESELRKRVSGEVRFDTFSKVLYSTDASIYQMEPVGVVIPKHKDDVLAVVDVANRNNVPIVPRGSGTSLAGQAVNHAIVIDFTRPVVPEKTGERVSFDGNTRMHPTMEPPTRRLAVASPNVWVVF